MHGQIINFNLFLSVVDAEGQVRVTEQDRCRLLISLTSIILMFLLILCQLFELSIGDGVKLASICRACLQE